MSLTATMVSDAFAAARTALGGAAVTVRIGGREYSGVRASTEFSDHRGAVGAIQGATGAVRLRVSELPAVHPAAGDKVEVKETATGNTWQRRDVLTARYDQTGATLRIDYGEQYGG